MSKLSEARHRIEAMGMAEAQEELRKLRRQLFDLRFQLARGEVKNNRQFPQIRADIARLMFHISELNREERREASRARQGLVRAEPAETAEASAVAEPVEEAPAKPARKTTAHATKAAKRETATTASANATEETTEEISEEMSEGETADTPASETTSETSDETAE